MQGQAIVASTFDTFIIASAAITAMATGSASATVPGQTSIASSGGLSVEANVANGIVVPLVVIAAAAATLLVWRRRRRHTTAVGVSVIAAYLSDKSELQRGKANMLQGSKGISMLSQICMKRNTIPNRYWRFKEIHDVDSQVVMRPHPESATLRSCKA